MATKNREISMIRALLRELPITEKNADLVLGVIKACVDSEEAIVDKKTQQCLCGNYKFVSAKELTPMKSFRFTQSEVSKFCDLREKINEIIDYLNRTKS